MIQEQLRLWLVEKLNNKGRGSKKELAAALGVLPSTLTSILKNENGHRAIKIDELVKIINFFNEIPPFLLGNEADFIKLFYRSPPHVQDAVITLLQNSHPSTTNK